MKAKTQLWHILVITLALLITACGGSSESAGGVPVNWDYVSCNVGIFFPAVVPSERKEEDLYAGQSIIKQGSLSEYELVSFQVSLQESGTITVSASGTGVKSIIVSANDCTELPLTSKVTKGPYYVIIANPTYVNSAYSLIIDLE